MSDPSLAAERTDLAWHRTSMSFLVLTALAVRVLVEDNTLLAAAVAVPGCVAAVVAWRHARAVWARRALTLATVTIAALVTVAAFTTA